MRDLVNLFKNVAQGWTPTGINMPTTNINLFRAKLTWLDTFQWKWAQGGGLSKLLEIAFGLPFATQDVDTFLSIKLTKMLTRV